VDHDRRCALNTYVATPQNRELELLVQAEGQTPGRPATLTPTPG
jgi:hypothetical protein